MASEDEIDQYEYFKYIAEEELDFNIWKNSGRFVLLDKYGGVIASFLSSQELCQFINGVCYGKALYGSSPH